MEAIKWEAKSSLRIAVELNETKLNVIPISLLQYRSSHGSFIPQAVITQYFGYGTRSMLFCKPQCKANEKWT